MSGSGHGTARLGICVRASVAKFFWLDRKISVAKLLWFFHTSLLHQSAIDVPSVDTYHLQSDLLFNVCRSVSVSDQGQTAKHSAEETFPAVNGDEAGKLIVLPIQFHLYPRFKRL